MMYTIWSVLSLLIAGCRPAAQPGNPIFLFVRSVEGGVRSIELPNTATVGRLKREVGTQYVVSFGDVVLTDDDAPLADLGFGAEATVVLSVKRFVPVQVRLLSSDPFKDVEVSASTFQEFIDKLTYAVRDITNDAETVNFVYWGGPEDGALDKEAYVQQSKCRIKEGLGRYGIVVTEEELDAYYRANREGCKWHPWFCFKEA